MAPAAVHAAVRGRPRRGGELEPAGEPQTFTPTAEENKLALGAVDEEQGSVEREFTLDRTADAVRFDLTWDVPAEDYDLYVYRVLEGGERVQVGNSGNPPGSFEQTTLNAPQAGNYVLRVVYYATATNGWKATMQPLAASPRASCRRARPSPTRSPARRPRARCSQRSR